VSDGTRVTRADATAAIPCCYWAAMVRAG